MRTSFQKLGRILLGMSCCFLCLGVWRFNLSTRYYHSSWSGHMFIGNGTLGVRLFAAHPPCSDNGT
ncbi:hypothetical protein L209DRAFT_755034 [Thermothelomyces heterothallicus CBS 203.75]